MNIICLTKTYLDSRAQLGDENLEIPGYKLFCSDYQLINKLEVFLYYKTSLPLIVIEICRNKYLLK